MAGKQKGVTMSLADFQAQLGPPEIPLPPTGPSGR
jgi:hypothetical protein